MLTVPSSESGGRLYPPRLSSLFKKGADMLGGLVTEMYARRLSTRDVEVMFIEAFRAARARAHRPVQRQLYLSYEMSKGRFGGVPYLPQIP
ncbi:MAG: hypothetical protein KAW83_01665 [Dehalococcoidia bacterium]|nr:hypothetical protein [Dehalococcoidia bacterium]